MAARLPTNEELGALFNQSFQWTTDHGWELPPEDPMEEMVDGLVVSNGQGPYLEAHLRTDTLARHEAAARPLAALGVSTALTIQAHPAYYELNDRARGGRELNPPRIVFGHETSQRSRYEVREYRIEQERESGGEISYTGDEESYRRDGELVDGALKLSQYRALRTLMGIWVVNWQNMAESGEERRLEW